MDIDDRRSGIGGACRFGARDFAADGNAAVDVSGQSPIPGNDVRLRAGFQAACREQRPAQRVSRRGARLGTGLSFGFGRLPDSNLFSRMRFNRRDLRNMERKEIVRLHPGRRGRGRLDRRALGVVTVRAR